MKKSDLEKRVDELERRIKELEAQPREYHYHYHPPVFQQPYMPPNVTHDRTIYIGDPPSGYPWTVTNRSDVPFTLTAAGGQS